ncbi:type II CAAX endopeptidase family protein [Neobacillus sp. FSL H8-0543]|uniref:CPBP family intramembrane glutamic endopeptidase n=1 Tax=Neobacillus sp. FSL H8-0543 TaxID=2954672 RepID=UPI003157FBFE
MEKHRVASYFIITMLISVLLLPLHFVFQTVGNYSVSFTQFAPALAVGLFSVVTMGKIMMPRIIGSSHIHGDNLKWMGLAFLLPFLCIAVSSIAISLFGITYKPWNGSAMFYFINIIAILLGCTAEEIGWRGFLLPQFQKRYSPILSSLMVGILWGVWHLNFTGGLLGFVLYIITIVESSILMTWLYNKTDGNLTTMIVYHFTFSFTSHVLLWGRFNLQLFITEIVVFGLACAFVVLKNREMFFHTPIAPKI